jgi:DNA-binding GntR family transcriptional regulator
VTTAADFYSIILANCGNAILEEVHRGLVARISFFRGRSMSLEGRAQSSLAEMRDIFEAIAAGPERGTQGFEDTRPEGQGGSKRSMEGRT